MDTSIIVNSIFLLDFYERKNNCIIPADSTELNFMSIKFKKNKLMYRPRYSPFYMLDETLFRQLLENTYPLIFNILMLGNGRISIFGTSMLDLMLNLLFVNEFELYFHSCDISEALVLLEDIHPLLDGEFSYQDDYVNIRTEHINIKIYYTIYKTKENVLKNFFLIPFRHGWNPIDGYFSTFNAILSLAIKGFPLELYDESILSQPTILELLYYKDIRWISNKINRNYGNPLASHAISIHNFLNGKIYQVSSEESIPIKYIVSNDKNRLKQMMNIHQDIYNFKIKSFTMSDKPIITGITNDRYIAFVHCRSKFNLTRDMFKLLCDYWLLAEVLIAKRILLDDNS